MTSNFSSANSDSDVFGSWAMQVDNTADLQTPPRRTPGSPQPDQPHTPVPDQMVQLAYNKLQRMIFPNDDDDAIGGNLDMIWTAVHGVLSKRKANRKLAKVEEFQANVARNGEQPFFDLLRHMARLGVWESIFDNENFFMPIPAIVAEDAPEASMRAALHAWNSPFQGKAADVLLLTVKAYLNPKRNVYTRHASIINSSGTGKSRMVDELSTKVVTVPMCLRDEGSASHLLILFYVTGFWKLKIQQRKTKLR